MDEKVYTNSLKVIEGTFDGENMWGDDSKIYPVPPNYASKSKLIEGDKMKLYLQHNGNFIFKQTHMVERKSLLGKITQDLNVRVESTDYKVLPSSLTYFKASPGDEAVVIIPAFGHPTWCALQNIIKANPLDIELKVFS